MFNPVQDEALPDRLLRAARPRTPWYAQRLAASVAIALVSGTLGWGLHGALGKQQGLVQRDDGAGAMQVAATSLVRSAAIAHAVYSVDQRRPVEVDAAHEDQLVAWLSKRMGASMRPPRLQSLGYALEGGRLLPGNQGPVAQFMYRDEAGAKLTLYVSREAGPVLAAASAGETAFRFARDADVNVFYWIDSGFRYALSSKGERSELARVSSEVYRQLMEGTS